MRDCRHRGLNSITFMRCAALSPRAKWQRIIISRDDSCTAASDADTGRIFKSDATASLLLKASPQKCLARGPIITPHMMQSLEKKTPEYKFILSWS